MLYGPPGTGKTLMARQIGQMLNAREPKIVNGPQILDKYVGESEANVRRLFADAEEEEKRVSWEHTHFTTTFINFDLFYYNKLKSTNFKFIIQNCGTLKFIEHQQ